MLVLSVIRLSEILQDTYGLHNVRVSLLDPDNDSVELVTARNGELVSVLRLQTS